MVEISRILVAVDGSESADRALEYAAYLAKQSEAEQLFIVNVIEGFGRNTRDIREWKKHDSLVKALLGSVSHNVIHHAKCPVVIVR